MGFGDHQVDQIYQNKIEIVPLNENEKEIFHERLKQYFPNPYHASVDSTKCEFWPIMRNGQIEVVHISVVEDALRKATGKSNQSYSGNTLLKDIHDSYGGIDNRAEINRGK